ncbi:hypothetical protein Enr13x_15730 [Stieleria neptunia]|uniref:Uncharacterized protein n=1 Tax=Stieleria neptunia TaxID=2527979 RepID=A0A518HLN5_9BACT|nr:hypothetical protein Enr13x_15730 [Stieleria neptunia]
MENGTTNSSRTSDWLEWPIERSTVTFETMINLHLTETAEADSRKIINELFAGSKKSGRSMLTMAEATDFTVADALRTFAPGYIAKYHQRMPPHHRTVLGLITRCKTGNRERHRSSFTRCQILIGYSPSSCSTGRDRGPGNLTE